MKLSTTLFRILPKLTAFVIFMAFVMNANADCLYKKVLQGEDFPIGTMLSWSTAYEKDNSSFIIEKSDDGVDFVQLGKVKAIGFSENIEDYSFLDVNATDKKVFYRLKQINTDGSFQFSDVILMVQENKNDFNITRMSSVTTSNLFEFEVNIRAEGEFEYRLLNWKGETLSTEKIYLEKGKKRLGVDISNERKGIYKLELAMDGEKETLVIEKVNRKTGKNGLVYN